MIAALFSACEADNGVEAGEILAYGGWAVFPVPLGAKFDSGPGAQTYRDATTEASEWLRMAERVMARHGCPDVNIAVSPWGCRTPLVGIDLDGHDAVEAFRAEHGDDYFHVVSSGKGGGRHVYVAGFPVPVGGTNPWGGEYRSGRGHLMLPPSAIEGNRDYYRPVPGGFLTGIELHARTEVGGERSASIPLRQAHRDVLRLSRPASRPAAFAAFKRRLDALGDSRPGERHPAMVSAVCSAVRLSCLRVLPLKPALDLVVDAFPDPESSRDVEGEVLAVAAWALAQEAA